MHRNSLLIILMLVGILIAGIHAAKSSAENLEVTFKGTAIERFETSDFCGWIVQTNEVVSGPSELSNRSVKVYRTRDLKCSETIDPDTKLGDLVGVFGLYTSNGEVLLLQDSNHHLRLPETSALSCKVRGFIFDYETEDPVVLAEVTIYSGNLGHSVAVANSDQDGMFLIEGTTEANGEYTAICTAEGYETWNSAFTTDSKGDCWIDIELYPVENEEEKPVFVSGCIFNAATEVTLARATVEIQPSTSKSCLASACSGSCGEFCFGNEINSGAEYVLTCELSGYESWDEEFFSEDGEDLWFDIELEPVEVVNQEEDED